MKYWSVYYVILWSKFYTLLHIAVLFLFFVLFFPFSFFFFNSKILLQRDEQHIRTEKKSQKNQTQHPKDENKSTKHRRIIPKNKALFLQAHQLIHCLMDMMKSTFQLRRNHIHLFYPIAPKPLSQVAKRNSKKKLRDSEIFH